MSEAVKWTYESNGGSNQGPLVYQVVHNDSGGGMNREFFSELDLLMSKYRVVSLKAEKRIPDHLLIFLGRGFGAPYRFIL